MKIKKCKVCGEALKWGEFAYMQHTCWKCFKLEIEKILIQLQSQEQQAIVAHMMDCMAEMFGKDRFRRNI